MEKSLPKNVLLLMVRGHWLGLEIVQGEDDVSRLPSLITGDSTDYRLLMGQVMGAGTEATRCFTSLGSHSSRSWISVLHRAVYSL